jgi:DNA-binding response OmpR family regulator
VTSAKGRGSTFTVVLNRGNAWLTEEDLLVRKETEAAASPEPEIEVSVAEGAETTKKLDLNLISHQPTLLIVEDNLDLRQVITDMFSPDFKVLEADDGIQGYDLCYENHPDIVISDIMMPHMNGIELCCKLKSEEETSHIPVLLLTARDTEESKIEGFQTGADAYVPKPFNPKLLRAQVVSLLVNRENLRSRFQKEIEINPMIISNSPVDAKFLDRILEIIEENLSDSEFSVEKLAAAYGVSRIYLNRKIKALTGETSNQFLRNIRLKHAAELLKQNVLTVSEITWHVGYNDLRTFRTRFKDKFGMSPSDYARNLKEEASPN